MAAFRTLSEYGNTVVYKIAPIVTDNAESESFGVNLTLREKLIVAQKTSQFDAMQPYLPAKTLARIRDKDIEADLQDLLGRVNKDERDKFRLFVLQMAWKIYLILVYCRLTSKMLDFFACDYDDGDLPVGYDMQTGEVTTMTNHDGYCCSEEEISVFSKSRWRPAELQEFCNNQWRFLAPKFDRPSALNTLKNRDLASIHQFRRIFLPQHILPFDVVGRPKGTSFSKVWKIQIHPDHLSLYPAAPDGIMALKVMADDVEAIRDQQEISMSRLEHKALMETKLTRILDSESFQLARVFRHNIVALEYAFQRGSKAYLMFRWAEFGNLYSFWRDNDPDKLSSEGKVLSWVKGQIGGLLGALCLLHSLDLRHGDLKPDNILVFADQAIGRLKIADFGLARSHIDETNKRGQETIMMTGAQRYEPPQVNKDHEDRYKAWSRRYDVWSMGCIFLEFIVWLCGGQSDLTKFNEELGERRTQKFWKFENGKPIYQPAVVDEIGRLNKVLRGPQWDREGISHERRGLGLYLLYVLEKVEKRMLVLQTDEEKYGAEDSRATSESLFKAFTDDDMLGSDLMNRWKMAEKPYQ